MISATTPHARMMRIIASLAVWAFTVSLTACYTPRKIPAQTVNQALEADGYAKAKWGMSLDQVRNLYPEIRQLEEGRPIYFYLDRVIGKPAKVAFQFESGRLVGAMVLFQERYETVDAYAEEYESIRQLLTKKYGKASFETIDHPKNEGSRIISGWNSGKTFLTLKMEERDRSQERFTSITYSSKEFGELARPKSDGLEKL